MMRFTSKLGILIGMLIVALSGGFTTSRAAPLNAASSITVSPTSAACNQSGGELNFSVTANPGGFVPATVEYHAVVTSHIDLNDGLNTYVSAPITFNKRVTWTADTTYFWEQATSYSFVLKVMLMAKPGLLDYATINLTCSKRQGVILNYSNN